MDDLIPKPFAEQNKDTNPVCNRLQHQKILCQANEDKSKGKVDSVASPVVDAVQIVASGFVDPEAFVAVACGASIGVHLKFLRATEYRPVHNDPSCELDFRLC